MLKKMLLGLMAQLNGKEFLNKPTRKHSKNAKNANVAPHL